MKPTTHMNWDSFLFFYSILAYHTKWGTSSSCRSWHNPPTYARLWLRMYNVWLANSFIIGQPLSFNRRNHFNKLTSSLDMEYPVKFIIIPWWENDHDTSNQTSWHLSWSPPFFKTIISHLSLCIFFCYTHLIFINKKTMINSCSNPIILLMHKILSIINFIIHRTWTEILLKVKFGGGNGIERNGMCLME